jgi:hypothetical protein
VDLSPGDHDSPRARVLAADVTWAVTDLDGGFTLDVADAGPHHVALHAWEPRDEALLAEAELTAEVDPRPTPIRLWERAALSCTLVDEAGRPLALRWLRARYRFPATGDATAPGRGYTTFAPPLDDGRDAPTTASLPWPPGAAEVSVRFSAGRGRRGEAVVHAPGDACLAQVYLD